jgi:hypothetical protein
LDIQLQEELTVPIVDALDHVSKTHAVMEGTVDQDMKLDFSLKMFPLLNFLKARP